MAEMTLTLDQWKAISKSEMQERVAIALKTIDDTQAEATAALRKLERVTVEQGALIAQLNDLQSYIDAITAEDIAGAVGLPVEPPAETPASEEVPSG